MIKLYGCASDNITLSESLDACQSILSDSVALLYSPICCQFAKLLDRTLKDYQENEIDLSLVFEARVFNKDCELRWLNKSNGKGKAVLLSEKDISALKYKMTPLQVLNFIKQQYLLWGQGVEYNFNADWGKLAAARIGSLYVSVSGLRANQRVYLKTREYLGEDAYGNVSVVEERLIELKVK